jgi:hypothetical protein
MRDSIHTLKHTNAVDGVWKRYGWVSDRAKKGVKRALGSDVVM